MSDPGIELVRIIRARLRLLTISIVVVYLILSAGLITGVVGGYIWISEQSKNENKHERIKIEAEHRQFHILIAQTKFQSYILCRIEGQTKKQCRKIARGIILPPNLTLKQIDAQIFRIAELTATRIITNRQH